MIEWKDKDISKLLRAIKRHKFQWDYNQDYYKERDRTILLMALYLGLRLDEIANARLCFLDKGNSFYSVSAKVSKSKRNRIVPIPKFFLKDILSYIKKYKIKDYLFESRVKFHRDNKRRMEHLDPRSIYHQFEKYRTEAGLTALRDIAKGGNKLKTLRFHDLRFTYANKLLSSGANLKIIQENLGHAWISTTERYLCSSIENRSIAVQKAFKNKF